MGFSISFAKLILFIFNVTFFLFGVVSLSLGIWVVASKNELFRFINLIDTRITDSSNQAEINRIANQHGLVEIAGYILIGLGLLTLIIGFCGCCGAMKESKAMLIAYVVLVGIVLVLEITSAILAAVFQNRVRGEAVTGMKHLQNNFFVALPEYEANNNSANSAVTYAINYVQVAFDCCGAAEVGDIAKSKSWTESERMMNDRRLVRPVTCCKVKDKAAINWNSFDLGKLADKECPFSRDSKEVNQQTCYAGISQFVKRYSVPLIAICVCIGLIELIGIILGLCLIQAIDNDKNYAKQ